MEPEMASLVRQLQETPESAVQSLAFMIGFVSKHLTERQRECAIDCLIVLARKARVDESVIEQALR